ncbi:MAG TPA: AMP-binding protein [Thermodesulfobacteriota bacterium]|nr:AMP-binding protein [Thermodesulfobacteriota bacterium]
MSLQDFTIYDLIARNALIFARRIAWVIDQKRLTFIDFYNNINSLAYNLEIAGLKKGDRIGILSQNCYEFVLLYGAAARLGAIMLPLNWRLSAPEVEYILSDGRPRFLFVGPDFKTTIRGLMPNMGFIEKCYSFGEAEAEFEAFSTLMKGEGKATEVDIQASDPYLIIHTAAVAGKPRGATLSHGNIIAGNLQHMATMGLREVDSYLHMLPLFHIADLALSFAVMHAGGKNVLMTKFDPELALQLIEKEKITTLGEFPPMLGMLLEKLQGKNYDISSLKHVGGIDHPSNIERLKKKANVEFWIGFGQSETTGMVTVCAYTERPGSAGKEGPLAKIKLVDDHDREVPVGTPGEICVRGPLVFLGYWKLEEDTRYTFRQGWHHTGDIGRLDENGYLWYVKRKAEKELIKPGGENVYPAEVEKAILEHPEVADVAVFGVRDKEWGEAVKAVCVLKTGSVLTQQGLIDFVASKIARYKKPKYVDFVPALPKTQEGTVDREKVKAEYGKAS